MVNPYRHPGVYIEELQGPQQIAGAGTSTTVFIGVAEMGPLNTPKLIDSWNAFQRDFGNFLWNGNLPFAVYNFFAEGGSLAYVVRAAPNPPSSMLAAQVVAEALTVSASTPGAWGNKLAILIENYPLEEEPSTAATPIFVLRILYKVPDATAAQTVVDQLVARYVEINDLAQVGTGANAYWVIEEFPGLTAFDLKKADALTPSAIETRVNMQSLFVRVSVSGLEGSRPGNLILPTPLAGGAGDYSTNAIDYPSALSSLDPLNDISLIVLPDTSLIDDLAVQRSTVQVGLSYCSARDPRDLFMICDAPYGLNVQDVVAFKNGTASPDLIVPAGNALNSSYGAIYYPFIDFLNGLTARSVPIPPSGAVAGTYAATDLRAGVFKAPAGVGDGKLDSAVGLSALLTNSDQDVLNPNGINAIRSLPRYGIVVYGARTLSTDPSLVYVNVRRLLIFIEISLYWGTQWVVFEPNGQQLWGSINRDFNEFLTSVWQAGGLVGAKESEAFQVQVDAGNNPPATQNQGILFIDVKVAPTRPAEFVVIRIQQATLSGG